MKRTILLFCAIAILTADLVGQGYGMCWNKLGNTFYNGQRFGTTNDRGFPFVTNNLFAGYVDTLQNWGFGAKPDYSANEYRITVKGKSTLGTIGLLNLQNSSGVNVLDVVYNFSAIPQVRVNNSSASGILSVKGATGQNAITLVNNSGNEIFSIQNDDAATRFFGNLGYYGSGIPYFGTFGDHSLKFVTNSLYRGALDSSGRFLWGGTFAAPNITLSAAGAGVYASTLQSTSYTATTGSCNIATSGQGLSFFGAGLFFNNSGSNIDVNCLGTSAKFRVVGTPTIAIADYSNLSSTATLNASVNSQIVTGIHANNTIGYGAFTGVRVDGFRSSTGFAPTSGTHTFNGYLFDATINQTGGANGITRGFYANPTLTASADYRGFATSNNAGHAFYAEGTAPSYFGGTVIANGTVRLRGYTVATLPGGAVVGDCAYVTDATAPTYRAVVVGGGAVVTKVFYDGTNWITD